MPDYLRKIITLSCVCLIVLLTKELTAAQMSQVRQEQLLEQDWKFHKGSCERAEEIGFKDADWERIRIPHTWNARDGQRGGEYYRGDGWYRRHFTIVKDWAERRIYLQFDGANRNTEVFLNGKRVGEHRGGFARFRFDITEAVKREGDNLLAVRVNNEGKDGSAPVGGDFTSHGGLYRTVSLFCTAPLQIETMDRASSGVFIKPIQLDTDAARMAIRVQIRSHAKEDTRATLRVQLINAAGKTVVKTQHEQLLKAGVQSEYLGELSIKRPRLWEGREKPYLYMKCSAGRFCS